MSIAKDPPQTVIRVTENLRSVRRMVRNAAEVAGRDPAEIRILAVSKRHSVDAIRAAAAAGQTAFGENYVQEALAKIDALADLELEWHFIGAIQSNKTRDIAARFDWVHTVDRAKIARRLNEQRPHHAPPLNVCIQVNVDDEPQKAGVDPAELPGLAQLVDELPRLRLRGLMCIPKADESGIPPRGSFAALRRLAAELAAAGIGTDTLSMGMSADIEAAIAEGATIVRIGTAIFGPRPD